MPQSSNKTIFLCLTDGIGISSSWQGNALSLGTKNILDRFLKEYPSEILKTEIKDITKLGHESDIKSSYQRVLSGQNVLPIYDQINKLFVESSYFHNLFEMPEKHHSSLHLVGTVSPDNFYGSQEHLLEIIKQAKSRGIYNLNLHFLIDDSFKSKDQLLNCLQEIENYISKLKLGQICSVIGRDYLDQKASLKNFNYLLSCLISGNANKTLSYDQAINTFKNRDHFSKIPPTSIAENGYPIGRIQGYDTVLFYDYNNDDYNYLINKLNYGSGLFGFKIPKSLNIFTLSPSNVENINTVFSVKDIEYLFSYLPSHIKINITSDLSRYTFFKPILKNKTIDSTFIDSEGNENNFYSKILYDIELKSKKYNLIILSIPFLDQTASTGSMENTIKSLNHYFEFLENIEKFILRNDLIFILTSSFARVDNLNNKRDNLVLPSFNAVPFIVLSKYRSSVFGLQTEPDSNLAAHHLNLKYSILDIAPTILQMFEVKKPAIMTGQSLLD